MLKRISLAFLSLLTIQIGYSQCQTIIPSIDPSITGTIEIDPTTGDDIIFYDICQGESIFFDGDVEFPQNNTTYLQTPQSSIYTWSNNGGNYQVGYNTNYNFPDAGGYEIVLDIEDVNGCTNTVISKVFVRVSTTPEITLTADPSTVCPNTNSDLEAIIEFTPTTWEIDYNNTFSEELFIPDGPSCPPGAYETAIEFNSFLPNQSLTDINDFLRVCIEMEHTWMGDIMINLHAPNGNTVILLEDQNGAGVGNGMGGTDLGLPGNNDSWNDECDPTENPAGTGFTYCWSPNPTTDNWHQLSDNGQLDNPVQESVVASSTNIFSDYNNSFNTIVNTPLNGTWTVEVIDTWGGDNGWIFQWWIDFDIDILPTNWSFTPSIESGAWQQAATTTNINNNTMTINPPTPGLYSYDYVIEDNFGCEYSESVQIEAINGVELQSSTTSPDECTQGIGSATIEGVGGLEPYLYFWTTLGISGPNANNLTSGSYPYSITDAQGCIFEGVTIVDQIGLEVELEVLDSSDDICELGMGEMLVQATSGTAPFSFNWANSSSVSALGTNLLTGLQSVVATDFNGCQGEVSYFIENTPPPFAEFSYLLDSCTNELTLFNETDDIISSFWQMGENLTSTQQNTSVSLDEGGIYPVTLITANEYCADTLTKVIDLTHTSAFNRIKFANVFTPNGDLTNDYFTIRGLKECDHGVLRIFNRWGEEMYYSINPLLEPWDGNHLGFGVSEGAYFYVLDLKNIQLKGVLNLYR